METKVTSPAIKGLIISLLLIVLSVIIHIAGYSTNKSLSWLSTLLFGIGIIWANTNYSKQLEGNVTFGNTFAHGFKTAAAVTAIMAVYSFIAVKYVMPEIIDYAMDEARKNLIKKGDLSTEQIEQNLALGRKLTIPVIIAGGIVVNLIIGCISSLIGAAVAKKNPNYNPLAEN